MMNLYFSFSALMSRILVPVSTVASPIVALSQEWCTELSKGYGLDLGPRSDGLT